MDIEAMIREAFVRDATKSVKTLSDFLENPDFESDSKLRTFFITVHGIKSSLSNIGETELAGAALRLEELERSQDYELVIRDALVFVDGLRVLLEKMQSSQDGVADGDDPGDLRDRLHDFIGKCADYNRRGALEIIADIKNCSAKTRAVLERLKEHVLNSGYEEAEATAARYTDEINKG